MNFYTGLKPCVKKDLFHPALAINIKIDVLKVNWCFHDLSATKTPKHKISDTLFSLPPLGEGRGGASSNLQLQQFLRQ